MLVFIQIMEYIKYIFLAELVCFVALILHRTLGGKQMDKQRHTGRAFLGFLLTFFMFFTLVAGGTLASLKFTILKGDDFSEFIKNLDLKDTIEEVVINEVKNMTSEENSEEGDVVAGLTSNAVDALLTEDIVGEMTDTITTALTTDEEIDLTDMKDSCMNVVKDISSNTIDELLSEIESGAGIVSVDALKNSSVILQFEQDYDVDITTTIIEQVEATYGSSEISLEEIDIEEVKAEAHAAVDEHIIPAIEEQVNTYIEEANEVVNKEIRTIKEDSGFNELVDAFNLLLKIVNIALIVAAVMFVFMALVQILAVYRKEMNRGIKNTGISAVLAAVILIIVGLAVNIAKDMVLREFSTGEQIKQAVGNFVGENISSAVTGFVVTSVIFVVIFVVCLISAIIIKKKRDEKNALHMADSLIEDHFSSND